MSIHLLSPSCLHERLGPNCFVILWNETCRLFKCVFQWNDRDRSDRERNDRERSVIFLSHLGLWRPNKSTGEIAAWKCSHEGPSGHLIDRQSCVGKGNWSVVWSKKCNQRHNYNMIISLEAARRYSKGARGTAVHGQISARLWNRKRYYIWYIYNYMGFFNHRPMILKD